MLNANTTPASPATAMITQQEAFSLKRALTATIQALVDVLDTLEGDPDWEASIDGNECEQDVGDEAEYEAPDYNLSAGTENWVGNLVWLPEADVTPAETDRIF